MKNINEMIYDIIDRCNKLISSTLNLKNDSESSKDEACSRLKLVLMQDRSGLSQEVLTKMKDELVEVISRYVDIDREALDLNLANEGNSLALVASIPVLRAKPEKADTEDKELVAVEETELVAEEVIEAETEETVEDELISEDEIKVEAKTGTASEKNK